MKSIKICVFGFCFMMLSASCSAKHVLVNDNQIKDTVKTQSSVADPSNALLMLTFARKVYDTQVYSSNITGSMTFNLVAGDKNITVPGSLHMRKNQIIRLQLFIPLLGTEVGRMDFTPDYVLIVDRIHKQYIKADYNQIDFLKKQGINFYSLQALFWNQLLVPGRDKLSDSDLKDFNVNLGEKNQNVPLILQKGKMSYCWEADKTSGKINETTITYKDSKFGISRLNWKYSDFTNVGVKQFPATQVFEFVTDASKQVRKVKVSIEMDKVETDSDWSTETQLSSKYTQIDAQDALSKIMNM